MCHFMLEFCFCFLFFRSLDIKMQDCCTSDHDEKKNMGKM